MIKESFVLRVLAVLFIFLALPLLIVCFILFQTDYQDAIEQAKKEIEVAARVRTYSIYQIKPFSLNFVGEVAYYLDLKNNWKASEEMNEKLDGISKIVGGILDVKLLKPTKKEGIFEIFASNKKEEVGSTFLSIHHLPFLSKGGIDSFVRTAYSEEKKGYVFYIFVAQAILDEKKDLLGYLVITSNIDDEIALVLSQGKELHEADGFAVVQEDGVICAASSQDLVGQYLYPLTNEDRAKFYMETDQTEEKHLLASEPLTTNWEKESNFFEFKFENETKLAFLPPPATLGVTILAYSNKQEVFNASMHRFLFFYNAYGLLLILGGAVTYWLSLLMSHPLQQLSALFKRFEQGDLKGRFKEDRFGYEINSLGNIFNQTIESFLENIQKAEGYRVAKETNKKELEIGYEVQRRLLPESMPNVPGLECYAIYNPTEIAGGDFYDFVEKEGKVYFFVGDTATKGITPCLYALIARSLIRSYIFAEGDVGKILSSANSLFCKDTGETGIFVTIVMGCFDTKTKILKYYSCGHPPGILRRANGHIELLTHRGMAMGLRETALYREESITLGSGDLLLFATDGLYRATNEKNQYFTLDRTIDILQHRNWHTAKEVSEGILSEVRGFCSKMSDSEITMVALRIM